VSGWGRDQLRATRKLNDDTSLNAEQTAALRGEIRAYKKLLMLSDPGKGMPEIEGPDDPTFAGY